ncbi:MAG: hypothetical protein ACTTIO_06605, partial [Candidatus Fimenecus sp.]
ELKHRIPHAQKNLSIRIRLNLSFIKYRNSIHSGLSLSKLPDVMIRHLDRLNEALQIKLIHCAAYSET